MVEIDLKQKGHYYFKAVNNDFCESDMSELFTSDNIYNAHGKPKQTNYTTGSSLCDISYSNYNRRK